MIDQRQLQTIFRRALCQTQKKSNQICSPLKISQPIYAEWSTYDRNNKGMYSYFYESKKFFGCVM